MKNDMLTIGMFFHSLGQGGVQRVMSLLTQMFIEIGYNVVIITEEEPASTDYYVPEEVRRYTISKMVSVEIDMTSRKREWETICTKENIDIMIYHASQYEFLLQDIKLIKECVNYFILYKHQVFSQELVCFNSFFDLYSRVFPLCARVIVLSQLEEKYWNMQGYNTKYIPNPSNYNLLWEEKRKWDYIVWTGRLDCIQKNYLDVIQIMKLVHQQYPNICLKMYGSGSELSVCKLKQEIAKEKLNEVVLYCGYERDIEKIYGDARMQLVTSSYEAFPMSILEGKLFSLPLVTYDLPYLELLSDANGYVAVKQRNIIKAAQAIVSILTDETKEISLRNEARQSGEKFHELEIRSMWLELLQNLYQDKQVQNEDDVQNSMLMKDIYKTIYSHAEMAIGRYKSLKEKYINDKFENSIYKIKYLMLKKNLKLVIYPYGRMAKELQEVLHKNGIFETLIVDNMKPKDAVPLSFFQTKNTEEYLVVVCSISQKYYLELHDELYRYFNKNQIIDIFTEEDILKRIM